MSRNIANKLGKEMCHHLLNIDKSNTWTGLGLDSVARLSSISKQAENPAQLGSAREPNTKIIYTAIQHTGDSSHTPNKKNWHDILFHTFRITIKLNLLQMMIVPRFINHRTCKLLSFILLHLQIAIGRRQWYTSTSHQPFASYLSLLQTKLNLA